MVAKSVIEEIRDRIDIVEIVGAHVELKRAGSNWKGLCPFHREKTPSFHVNQQRQIFHCFGCDAGGDAFRFIMDYEGVDFPMAIRLLAERCGVHIEEQVGSSENNGQPKDQMYRLLSATATLFHRALLESDRATAARDYLASRQLDGKTAISWSIGYAPDIRGALLRWAEGKKFTRELLESVGLLAKGDRGDWYERFRDRLMFPIQDEMGRVIGFSGREISGRKDVAKYINSPETVVFRKNRVFFGLDRARKQLVEKRVAIICEGQIDTIRCHEAGLCNVVASQGTALTENHARLINRYADAVILLLDADTAGQDAALRSAQVFLGQGLDVRVANLPPGEDPDSLILHQGVDTLKTRLGKALPVIDFQWALYGTRENLEDPGARQRAVQSSLGTVAMSPMAVQQEGMLGQLSKITFIPEHRLREDLKRFHGRRSAGTSVEPKPAAQPHPQAETDLLALMCSDEKVRRLVRENLPLSAFTHPDCESLAEIVCRPDTDPEQWSHSLDNSRPETQRLLARVQMQPDKCIGVDSSPLNAARDLLLRLYRKALEQNRELLRHQARVATGKEQITLTEACQQLSLDINALKQGWETALPILQIDPP